MSLPSQYKSINSYVLIEEIKKNPLLYDPKRRPNTTEMRKSAWDRVAQALFNEAWADFDDDEKESLVKSLQTKWKSLRDTFTRNIRKEKMGELDAAKRKKYMYYEELMFLAPYCGTKSYSNIIYLDESQNSNDSNIFLEEGEDMEQNISLRTSTGENADSSQAKEDSSNNNRITEVLEEIVKLQKSEKFDDAMGNKMFLLSLLPFLQRLPDDVNLEVRLQLMSVIQSYANGKNGF